VTKGGVPDVPDVDVVYPEGMLLTDNMKKEIIDFYNGCARPELAYHIWNCRAEDGT
jgi:hypothetical protein